MFRTSKAGPKAYGISGLGEDLDFFLRITEAGQGRNLTEVLHLYRLHDDSATFTRFDEVRRNYAYAVACAEARRNNYVEPDPRVYAKRWADRGSISKILARAECLGTRLYRKSRVRMANGVNASADVAGAAASVAIRPRLVYARTLIAIAGLPGNESL